MGIFTDLDKLFPNEISGKSFMLSKQAVNFGEPPDYADYVCKHCDEPIWNEHDVYYVPIKGNKLYDTYCGDCIDELDLGDKVEQI